MREDFFFADDLRDDDFLADVLRADDVLRAEDDLRADEVFRADDFFAALRVRPPLLLVSPDSRRCLFTVAAAMRFAVAVLRPLFFADDLIFSY